MHRFFAPAFDPGDDTVLLPKDEAEHLTRVLRLGVGDTVSVFDGRGHEYLGRVVTVQRRDVCVQLLSRIEPPPESSVHLTLAQAVLKGDKMDDVVRDGVMLGVAAIQPLITRRTEVTVAAVLRGARLERWRRVALASAKQSRRAVVPEICTPLSFETFVNEPGTDLRLILVEPGTKEDGSIESVATLQREPVPSVASLWVGPEGGWDEAERAAARDCGARLISLGRRTLRADAVPIVAVSLLDFIWNGSSEP